ncbi:serine protease inhibitor ecotin [Paenalcaligenes sp. Me52]|uniref:serine protease inhibitor ecotin n=1 Tax=Paenalcaligenes sp. Me52 TaxID=3392038 RepID=UPI003D275EAA
MSHAFRNRHTPAVALCAALLSAGLLSYSPLTLAQAAAPASNSSTAPTQETPTLAATPETQQAPATATDAEAAPAQEPAAATNVTEAAPKAPPANVITVNDPVDAFPAPEPGFVRHVIHLPVGNYENDLKVELLPGKVIETDCNTRQFIGQLEEKTLEGWGYTYYVLPSIEGPISTMMACPEDSKKMQFVPVTGSAGSLLYYNSRLPVVVYLPEEVELRWRTWVATPVVSADSQ